MKHTLYYVHDPMCSWCWAFRPTWLSIVKNLPKNIEPKRILGGLAPDSDEPMPLEMQHNLQQVWQKIPTVVPGTQFNLDFWKICNPRRSTWPACRAVIAATKQNPETEEQIIFAIQKAYYLKARNPSDRNTLIEIAGETDLDKQLFAEQLDNTGTKKELQRQIRFGQEIGAMGFPSLILQHNGQYHFIQYDYNDPNIVLNNELIAAKDEQR